MADKHWTNGTADKLWATAANWDPSGVPAHTDNVFIGGRSSDDIAGATVDHPAKLIFRNYSGSFGAAGNPVVLDHASSGTVTVLEIKGSGKFYIDTNNVTITDCIVAATGVNLAGIVLQGLYTNLFVLLAKMTFSGTVTDIYQEYITNKRANVVLLITTGAVVTNMRQLGGRSTVNKTITGDLHLDDGAVCIYDVGDVDGTAFIMAGSRLIYNSKGGDLENVEIFNRGVLDLTQSQDARSITTSCKVHAGGKIDASGVDDLITITPTILQIGQGAQILPANLGTRNVVQPGSLV